MNRIHSIDTMSNLPHEIEGLLATGPKTSAEITTATGVARSTVLIRLNWLKDDGLAHPVRTSRVKGGGTAVVWHAGPGAGFVAKRSAPIEVRRDPLVAALFGPARSAPRCVGCHMEQGAGHVAGCIVAQVAA